MKELSLLPKREPSLREKKRLYEKQWRKLHPNYSKEWRAKHPDKIREYNERTKKLKSTWARKGALFIHPDNSRNPMPWWVSEEAVGLIADDLNGTAKKEYWWQKGSEALP